MALKVGRAFSLAYQKQLLHRVSVVQNPPAPAYEVAGKSALDRK
jgi:hypothetical protein